MAAVVLLVETAGGSTVGVRFPTRDVARAWEDRHTHTGDLGTVVGCVDVVNRTEALRLSTTQE